MSSNQLLTLYCVLIVVASIFGGWLPNVIRLTHTRMQLIISFVGGLMLGIGLLHMLPHGVAALDDVENISHAHAVDVTVGWAMFGLLVMFFLIRTFHFHHHDTPELDAAGQHGHGDTDSVRHQCQADHHAAHELSWAGVAAGLSLHTLIDGVALAAAVSIGAAHPHGESQSAGLAGVGVFLAILLHKPLDALSITALMAAGGWSTRVRHVVNVAFALMCPVGAVLLLVGVEQWTSQPDYYIGCALGFSAGVFLCISLGDLLPELQFHVHDRLKLSAALLLGVALAYGIGFVEHAHVHGHVPSEIHHEHNHAHD